ncbi:hypothetical protein XarbCFBP7697_19915 [Xanthomonas arboricola]|nr:hypothetical protein XarbCFBP7697_19915 [Xanthomonas arboricola]
MRKRILNKILKTAQLELYLLIKIKVNLDLIKMMFMELKNALGRVQRLGQILHKIETYGLVVPAESVKIMVPMAGFPLR